MMTFGMLFLVLLTVLGSMILGWLLRRYVLGGRSGRFGSKALADRIAGRGEGLAHGQATALAGGGTHAAERLSEGAGGNASTGGEAQAADPSIREEAADTASRGAVAQDRAPSAGDAARFRGGEVSGDTETAPTHMEIADGSETAPDGEVDTAAGKRDSDAQGPTARKEAADTISRRASAQENAPSAGDEARVKLAEVSGDTETGPTHTETADGSGTTPGGEVDVAAGDRSTTAPESAAPQGETAGAPGDTGRSELEKHASAAAASGDRGEVSDAGAPGDTKRSEQDKHASAAVASGDSGEVSAAGAAGAGVSGADARKDAMAGRETDTADTSGSQETPTVTDIPDQTEAHAGGAAAAGADADDAPARQAALDASEAEVRQLRARLGKDGEAGRASSGGSLDTRLEASRAEASKLRQEVFAREADDGDAQNAAEAKTEAPSPPVAAETPAPPKNRLDAPETGRDPDDLTEIKGVGPKIQQQLNDEGIYYYAQIAEFSDSDIGWADETLGFRGRVARDDWVAQAKALASRSQEAASVEAAVDKPKPAKSAPPKSGTGARLNVLANAAGELSSLTKDADEPELSGSEQEAMRLIDSGDFVADDSNRPASLLDGPTDGEKDDLKEIKGVGPKLEDLLNGLGVFYFRQIAAFDARDIAWVDSKLRFRGRMVRDRWVDQAKRLT